MLLLMELYHTKPFSINTIELTDKIPRSKPVEHLAVPSELPNSSTKLPWGTGRNYYPLYVVLKHFAKNPSLMLLLGSELGR